jgi:hypothetical protein
MWFDLNFEGESQEEIDFRVNKCEIWGATVTQAKLIVAEYKKMESNPEEILSKGWWEHKRYQRFGDLLSQKLQANQGHKDQLRKLFRDQNDKLSYFDLFNFTDHVLLIELESWEEDDIEGRLDRLGMAFIEFNEFNEFSMMYGIDWQEPLLENDLEDILD